jgi:hypothetical protein
MCYIIVLSIIFYLGYGFGTLTVTSRQGARNVYVFDTFQKIKNYQNTWKEILLRDTNLSPDSPAITHYIDYLETRPPLAVVGPLFVCFNNENGNYLVCEENLHKPLVEWVTNPDLSISMKFCSKIEHAWQFPRIENRLSYSKEGCYEKGGILFFGQDGKLLRIYFDTKGNGIFDRMDTFINGIQTTYYLKELSYEKIIEKPYRTSLINYEDILESIR